MSLLHLASWTPSFRALGSCTEITNHQMNQIKAEEQQPEVRVWKIKKYVWGKLGGLAQSLPFGNLFYCSLFWALLHLILTNNC